LAQDGVAAINLKTKNIIWQTPFTTKVNVATTDTIVSYYNLVEGITYNDGLVFCVYRQVVTLKKQNGAEATQTNYKYLYLEAQSGKVLKEDSMDLAGKQLLFIDNKLICKNQQTNQTMRLDPNTGTMLWSYNDMYATRNNRSNANDRTISFYRPMNEADWQIVVLDFATGLPLFEKTLTNIPKHKIDQVLCQDGRVYVDMGAVYYENPLGVIKEHYKVYRVVFDQKSQEALWRSEIFEEKR
jgi:outer membrane protein assembly factor BamB